MARKIIREPLHKQIADILREEVLKKYKPGDKIPTEPELCKRFGVSTLTLREAVIVLSNEGLLEKRQGSGTYVLDSSGDKFIAIFCDIDITHPQAPYFAASVMAALQLFLRSKKKKYKVYLGNRIPGIKNQRLSMHISDELSEDLDRGLVSGIAAVTTPNIYPWRNKVEKLGIPAVGTGGDFEYCIEGTQYDVLVTGLNALVDEGCRKIAFMSIVEKDLEDATGPNGVLEPILTEHKMQIRSEWASFLRYPAGKGRIHDDFHRIWHAYKEKPDGLLIGEDACCQEICMAILKENITVPEQLKVATHVNKGNEYFIPFPVTKLEVDPAEFSRQLGDMLLKMITHEKLTSKTRRIKCTKKQE